MTSRETVEEKLEKLAQAIAPDETLIEKVMSRIDSKSIAGPSIARTQKIWRKIMKSSITKLTAAAVIIIACSTGLILWKSTGSGIALADVLTRIEQVTDYIYKMRSTKTRQQTTSEWTSTVLVSQENGIKMIQTRVDPNNGKSRNDEIYLLPRENTLLILLHQEKKIYRIKYEDSKRDYYKEEYNDPHTIVKEILSCSHTSLGQSVIDGNTVEGFQTTDLTYKGGFFGHTDMMSNVEKVDVKLWVDVKTFLPMRFEEDIVFKGGTHIHEVSYDFRWNVIVNAEDFGPNIPDDYHSPKGDFIVPAITEEIALKGLRLFANYAGNYPVIFDLDTLRNEAKKYIESDPVSYEELSEDEKTRKNRELATILIVVVFYEELVEKNKDPAYYGKTVGPEDADKVLLRWKLDDGQYRVIFGDLHADTVTADVMIELEMALPK